MWITIAPFVTDRDEVLRLKQISGLTELFEEEDFSPAWTVR
ncbi:transcriptional regulator [Salmonella enterica]|nr:transcriptional regulator [Salmonella enterica]